MQRRDFIQKTAFVGSSAMILPNIIFGTKAEDKKIRLGFIGVGQRGQSHVSQAMFRDDVEINAICDIDPKAIDTVLAKCKEKGRKTPAVYKNGDHDFENMVKRDDLDLSLIHI
jgi:predicted dehydrogenase